MSERTRFPVQSASIEIDAVLQREAYEVYSHCFGEQPELLKIEGCRGGFGTIELIAFLRARQFPKAEWKQRVDETFALVNHVYLRYR